MKKIKNIFRPKLKLVRGTRLTSALFIGVSMALAAGILWAANIYYDIDAGKIMVEEVQRVTGLLEAAGELMVTGNVTTTANLYVQGNTFLGDAVTDTITFNARAASDLVPSADRQYNLGSGDYYWKNLWVDTIFATTSIVSATTTQEGNIVMSDDTWIGLGTGKGRLVFDDQATDFLTVQNAYFGIATTTPSAELAIQGDIFGTGTLVISGSGTHTIAGTLDPTNVAAFTLTGTITGNDQQILDLDLLTVNAIYDPEDDRLDIQDNLYVSGQATTTARLYVTSGGLIVSGDVVFYDNLTVENVIPETDLTHTLGNASTYWLNLYVATTTVGSSASNLTLDVDDLRAPGGFTIYSGGGLSIVLNSAGDIVLQPASGSHTDVELAGTGLFRVGSADQFYIDALGNVTTTGSIYASRFFETGGGATVRKTGEEIVRGIVPIFGFDLPARCKTSCTGSFVTLTRIVENDPFPPAYTGTTRRYKFAIRYADATTTASSIWQVATSSDLTYVDQFTVPASESTDLAKGNNYLTGYINLPDMSLYDWFLRLKLGENGGYDFQVYEILLIGVDEVQ